MTADSLLMSSSCQFCGFCLTYEQLMRIGFGTWTKLMVGTIVAPRLRVQLPALHLVLVGVARVHNDETRSVLLLVQLSLD